MTQILLCGCGGAMGQTVTNVVMTRDDCAVAAGIDVREINNAEYPVYQKISDFEGSADVIVDFSHPSLLEDLLSYAKAKKMPIVLCTTGYSPEQVEQIKAAAKELPVFYSGNMSLGVNLLISLAEKAARVLGDSFDIEIIEQHHNQKIDAPSGTANMIADAISNAVNYDARYEYDRHSKRKKRDKNEIGIHSVRGGTIVGVHEVIFAGSNEVLTLTHSAQSKGVFAAGAVNAAVFMKSQAAGLYDMNQLIASQSE